MEEHEFERRAGDEPFRFRRTTGVGDFLVDLLMPKGASRARPPLIEPGLDSLAAPGLAYAIARGPERLDLRLGEAGRMHRFDLPIASLDAMLVMKATLMADGARSEPRRALRWLRERFSDERSAEARRVEAHFEREYGNAGGAAWAVAVVADFLAALDELR